MRHRDNTLSFANSLSLVHDLYHHGIIENIYKSKCFRTKKHYIFFGIQKKIDTVKIFWHWNYKNTFSIYGSCTQNTVVVDFIDDVHYINKQ